MPSLVNIRDFRYGNLKPKGAHSLFVKRSGFRIYVLFCLNIFCNTNYCCLETPVRHFETLLRHFETIWNIFLKDWDTCETNGTNIVIPYMFVVTHLLNNPAVMIKIFPSKWPKRDWVMWNKFNTNHFVLSDSKKSETHWTKLSILKNVPSDSTLKIAQFATFWIWDTWNRNFLPQIFKVSLTLQFSKSLISNLHKFSFRFENILLVQRIEAPGIISYFYEIFQESQTS